MQIRIMIILLFMSFLSNKCSLQGQKDLVKIKLMGYQSAYGKDVFLELKSGQYSVHLYEYEKPILGTQIMRTYHKTVVKGLPINRSMYVYGIMKRPCRKEDGSLFYQYKCVNLRDGEDVFDVEDGESLYILFADKLMKNDVADRMKLFKLEQEESSSTVPPSDIDVNLGQWNQDFEI